jgi:NAD(P)-dependent dehydrogenase (short-subunit alcohol dehydrogenase family)
MILDLACLSTVDDFVTEFTSKYGRCDVLMNNAGVLAGGLIHDRQRTSSSPACLCEYDKSYYRTTLTSRPITTG